MAAASTSESYGLDERLIAVCWGCASGPKVSARRFEYIAGEGLVPRFKSRFPVVSLRPLEFKKISATRVGSIRNSDLLKEVGPRYEIQTNSHSGSRRSSL